jgi:hypothetical protein
MIRKHLLRFAVQKPSEGFGPWPLAKKSETQGTPVLFFLNEPERVAITNPEVKWGCGKVHGRAPCWKRHGIQIESVVLGKTTDCPTTGPVSRGDSGKGVRREHHTQDESAA